MWHIWSTTANARRALEPERIKIDFLEILIKFRLSFFSDTTDACLVLLFRLPGERGKVSSSRCFNVAVLSAAKNVAIGEVAVSVDNLEEYSLVGIGLMALNYLALLGWWIKHRCQNSGDKEEGTVAAPAATPLPKLAAAAFAAPSTPSIAERHVEEQPQLFLLPKVSVLFIKTEYFPLLAQNNVLCTRQNCFVNSRDPKRGDVHIAKST